MYILTVLSILRQISIQILIIWLPVGCCDSGRPVVTSNNVQSCWSLMLRSFAPGFRSGGFRLGRNPAVLA